MRFKVVIDEQVYVIEVPDDLLQEAAEELIAEAIYEEPQGELPV